MDLSKVSIRERAKSSVRSFLIKKENPEHASLPGILDFLESFNNPFWS